MIETVILIPHKDNDRKSFPPSAWKELERRFAIFEWTRESDVYGEWVDDRRIYRDHSRQYTVALKSWLKVDEWLGVALWAKDYFRQKAVYIKIRVSGSRT